MSLQIRIPKYVGVWLAEPKTQRNTFNFVTVGKGMGPIATHLLG